LGDRYLMNGLLITTTVRRTHHKTSRRDQYEFDSCLIRSSAGQC
jgi:hypothetical protein